MISTRGLVALCIVAGGILYALAKRYSHVFTLLLVFSACGGVTVPGPDCRVTGCQTGHACVTDTKAHYRCEARPSPPPPPGVLFAVSFSEGVK